MDGLVWFASKREYPEGRGERAMENMECFVGGGIMPSLVGRERREDFKKEGKMIRPFVSSFFFFLFFFPLGLPSPLSSSSSSYIGEMGGKKYPGTGQMDMKWKLFSFLLFFSFFNDSL